MRTSLCAVAIAAFAAVWGSAQDVAKSSSDPLLEHGAKIYREQCLRCHGPAGEGVRDLCDRALVGDRSIVELSAVIDETMPEDDPSKCTGSDARAVARYIHETFYSAIAQARRAPPRVELSRLTVTQYRNTIADLFLSFQGTKEIGKARGLTASYYGDKNFKRNKRNLSRIDPQVRFDFGEATPDDEKFEAKGYSIQWEGSLYAPTSGNYELVVRSENAIKLWINDRTLPVIDGWVKSGDDREFSASIPLLGGRYYPLKLDFMKSTEKRGAIELCWRRPGREIETIGERYLTPSESNFTFVITTPFPPDDRSQGYERGASVSQEWDEATTFAALEVAKYMTSQMQSLAGVKPDAADRTDKLKDYCKRWVSRALGGALSAEQQAMYVDRPFEIAKDSDQAVQYCVLMTLKSPAFLYPDLPLGLSEDLMRAKRLAAAVWDSVPDNVLLKAAMSGKLKTDEEIRGQAERMQRDPRARAKIRGFLEQWLRIDQFSDLAKDPERYPDFSPSIASDLRESADLFLEDVFWSESSSFEELLLAEDMYVNRNLAKLYGAESFDSAEFKRVQLAPGTRAGILSHPLMMTGYAYHGTSSPIHRGVFISRSLLGRTLRPPPEAVAPLSPDLHADLTTRERVELQTRPAACQTCHAMINPLGFGLEQFDAVGRLRKEEQGKAIDARGKYFTRTGEKIEFDGVRDLAERLVQDVEVQQSFVEQMFHHLIHQPLRAYDESEVESLRASFAQQNLNMRMLARECAVVATRAHLVPAEGERP